MGLGFIVMLYAVEYAMVSAPVGVQWLLITIYYTLSENWHYLLLDFLLFQDIRQKISWTNDGPMVFQPPSQVLAGLFGGEATELD